MLCLFVKSCSVPALHTTDGGMKRWGFRSYFTIKVQGTLMREQKLD